MSALTKGKMPTSDIMKLDKYCAITFPNTHSALHGESVLNDSSFTRFIIMPVPGEISAGCGLAIKLYREDYKEVVAILQSAGVSIDAVYFIDKKSGTVEKIM